MEYLLIILVLAVALAPLSHFVPSKRQRHIARLREYAAVHGLYVEFRKLPGARAEQRTPGAVRGDVVYYGKRLRPRRGTPVAAGSWQLQQGEWRSVRRRLEVPGVLAQLPAEILAASVDESSCGVYWQESGSEQDVEQIRVVLEHWSEQLLQ